MKSILSKTMKYQQKRSLMMNNSKDEKKHDDKQPQQPQQNVLSLPSSSIETSFKIHEISTQSIIQTSALLHTTMQEQQHESMIIVTPTNSNDDHEGIESYSSTGTSNSSNDDDIYYDTDNGSLNSENDENKNENDNHDDDISDIDGHGITLNDNSKDENNNDDDDDEMKMVHNTSHSKNATMNNNETISRSGTKVSSSSKKSEFPLLLLDNVIISEECSVRVSSPLGEPKEVRFCDDDHVPILSLDMNHNDDDDEHLQLTMNNDTYNTEQEKEIIILHEQLRNTLYILSAEKAIRMKQDKSIIKLAKELKKRKNDTIYYKNKVYEMAMFIKTLQQQPKQQQEEVNTLQTLQEEEEEEVNKATTNTSNNNSSSNNTTTTTIAQYEQLIQSLNTIIEQLRNETMIQTIGTSTDSTCSSSVQQQEQELSPSKEKVIVVVDDDDHDEITSTSSTSIIVTDKNNNNTKSTDVKVLKSNNTNVWMVVRIVLVSVLSIQILFVYTVLWNPSKTNVGSGKNNSVKNHYNSMMKIKQNILCAPIRPGTKITLSTKHEKTNDPNYNNHNMKGTSSSLLQTFEAPWWIPNSINHFNMNNNNNIKQSIYNVICPNVPQSMIQFQYDTIKIYNIDIDTKQNMNNHTISTTNMMNQQGSNKNNKSKRLLFHGRGLYGFELNYYTGMIHLLRNNQRPSIDLPSTWIL